MTAASPDHLERLSSWMALQQRLLIAFSGGVDSSVVAAAASRAGLQTVIAVTADSPSVPRWQIELSRSIAAQIGIDHLLVSTHETELPAYQRNDSKRCFHCKQTLYQEIRQWADRRFGDSSEGFSIVSGTNADDLGDYRPGIDAGRGNGVLTPLAELGIGKDGVRDLARVYGLPNHDLPASPCLASRVAYGTEVTPERLRKIELAESLLREHGFAEVRVRLHADELARIEVAKHRIDDLFRLDRDVNLTARFRDLGFQFVTIDMEGFASGSLNRTLVSIGKESLASKSEVMS